MTVLLFAYFGNRFDYILNKDLSTALKPVKKLERPRLIKSHLPLPLLPAQLWAKKPKVILNFFSKALNHATSYYLLYVYLK